MVAGPGKDSGKSISGTMEFNRKDLNRQREEIT